VALQFRRGTEAERTANGFIPLQGEPVYATDTKKLYIGDGDTVGGNPVGYSNEITDLADVQLTGSEVIFIENIRAVENQVIITTKTPHGFATGDSVLISTATRPDLNGVRVVESNSISTLTYSQAVDDFGPTTDTGALRYEVADNAILAYSQETGTWTDQNYVYELEDLGDVKIANPTNGQIIQYTDIPLGDLYDGDGLLVQSSIEEPAELEEGFTWTQTNSIQKFVNKEFKISIDNLSDVLIYEGALKNKQYIGYDPSLTVWRNIDYVDNIQDLSNVTISNPTVDQILSYDGSTWTNKSFEINNFSLDVLNDVEIENLQEGQILQYSSSKWRNVDNFVSLNQFADVDFSDADDGEAIIYDRGIFKTRGFRLNDLQNINDLTEQFEVQNNSVLAFSNTEQKWKPLAFSALAQRTEVVMNTGPIEDLAVSALDVPIFPGFVIYKIRCSAAPTTVSMYITAASRDIDLSRPENELPEIGSGIYAEMTPIDTQYRPITPVIHGFNDEVPISNMAFLKIRNRSGYYQDDIEVRLTVLQIEKLPEY